MKVILLRDMANLGKRGEVKEVAEGYAMNVLIKKGDAVHATPAVLSQWKAKEGAKLHKKEIATNTFAQLIDSLRKNEIVLSNKKADQKGQLFASIKETDIADAIYSTTKMSVDPKQILLSSPIKSLGVYDVHLKQGERKEKITIQVK